MFEKLICLVLNYPLFWNCKQKVPWYLPFTPVTYLRSIKDLLSPDYCGYFGSIFQWPLNICKKEGIKATNFLKIRPRWFNVLASTFCSTLWIWKSSKYVHYKIFIINLFWFEKGFICYTLKYNRHHRIWTKISVGRDIQEKLFQFLRKSGSLRLLNIINYSHQCFEINCYLFNKINDWHLRFEISWYLLMLLKDFQLSFSR